jgi:hypothetical protein
MHHQKSQTTRATTRLLLSVLFAMSIRFYDLQVLAQSPTLGEALNATNLTWTTSSNAPWFSQSAKTHDGFAAAQSGTNANSSELFTTVTGPGTLNFWWMLDYAPGPAGFLLFLVNGTSQFFISAKTPWQQRTVYLADGVQTLDWRMSKFSSSPWVTGCLDQVTYTFGPTAPIVNSNSPSQTCGAGADVTLSASVVGTPPIKYQWQFDSADLPSATNSALSLTNVQINDAGVYTLIASNAYGATNIGPTTLTVTSTAPVIRVQPVDLVFPLRANARFDLSARGSAPLSYQWFFNSNAISGANSSFLLISGVQATNSGYYQCTVSNAYGSIASSNAFLVVGPRVVRAWGGNSYGQTNVPRQLTNVSAIAAGYYYNLALNPDGTLTGWGMGTNNTGFSGEYGQAKPPADLTNVITMTAEQWHSLAVRQDGSVFGWGDNTLGPLSVPPGLSNAIAIATGEYHSLGLRSDGSVIAWGGNIYHETEVPRDLTNVVAIAAGGYNSAALKADGTVSAWGYGFMGATNVPTGLSNVVAIAMGGRSFGFALKDDGIVTPWGSYGAGSSNIPPGLTNVIAIAAGVSSGLALTQQGAVVAWGTNFSQAGMPTDLTNVIAIAAGWEHFIIIMNDGSPAIARQPIDQIRNTGETSFLSVGALGTPPLTLQWQLNGTNIAGATSSRLVLTNMPLNGGGVYRCVISNMYGAVTSSPATLTIQRSTVRFDPSSAALSPNTGTFGVTLRGLSGHGNILIYASTNLATWETIYTNPPILGSWRFIDSVSTNYSRRFYRALEQ